MHKLVAQPVGMKAEFARGWLVLLAAFVGISASISSLNYYAAGIFILPLEEEFGWSRAAISGQGVISVAFLGLLSPFVGALIDRVGVRVVASISLVFYAACMYAMTLFVDSLWSFYILAAATALLAAGSSPVTFSRAVMGWFDKARGIALGLTLLGTGVAGVLAPLFLSDYVASNGWRMGYQLLAVIVLLAAIFVALFIKNDPIMSQQKDIGLSTSAQNTGLSYNEAFKTPVFYVLASIFILVALAVSGPIIHFIPMLIGLGVSATEAGQLAAIIGVSVMVGRLVTGVLLDCFFAPRVATLLFSLATLGFFLFLWGGANFAIFAAVAVGISIGGEVDLIGYMVSKYFGLRAYGVVYGSLYAVFVVGAGLSPFLTGVMYDLTGSYQIVFIIAAICLALASFLSLFLRPFPKLT